jgi:hypothetical protein
LSTYSSVGNRVVDGGGTDDPVAPIVVGPVPVLDGCPLVLDNKEEVDEALYTK